jgi:hypothetical protein
MYRNTTVQLKKMISMEKSMCFFVKLSILVALTTSCSAQQNKSMIKQPPLRENGRIVKTKPPQIGLIPLKGLPTNTLDASNYPRQYVDIKTNMPLNGPYSVSYDMVLNSEGNSGNIDEFAEGRFSKGYYDGKWIYYTYQNGKRVVLRTQHFTRGLPDGKDTVIINDTLHVRRFRNGTGTWQLLTRQKRLVRVQTFTQGYADGTWRYYAPDGSLTEERIYQKGQLVRRVEHGKSK